MRIFIPSKYTLNLSAYWRWITSGGYSVDRSNRTNGFAFFWSE